jgi:hypothetical protein
VIADIIAYYLPNCWSEAKATSRRECQRGGLLLPRPELCAPLADQPPIVDQISPHCLLATNHDGRWPEGLAMLMHWLRFYGRCGAATGLGSCQCQLGAKVLLVLPICARLRLSSLPMRHICRKEARRCSWGRRPVQPKLNGALPGLALVATARNCAIRTRTLRMASACNPE